MYRILLDAAAYDPTNFGEVAISLELQDEDGGYFFRRKLTQSLTFYRSAYRYILQQIELGQCQQIAIQIQQQCSGVYEDILAGYFTRQACAINYETCTIEVEITVQDDYTCLLDNINKDINILGTNDLDRDDFQYVPFYGLQVKAEPSVGTICTGIIDPFYGDPYGTAAYTSTSGENYCIYARYVVKSLCVAGVPQEPPAAITPWVLLSNDCATDGTATYYRNVQPTEILLSFTDAQCSGAACEPAGCSLFCIDLGVFPYGILQNDRICACPSYTQFMLPNGRKLTDSIDYILSQTCPSLTLQSELLTNEINYVTGSTANPLKDLFIFQKSDIVRATASEVAAVGNLSIKKIMKDLATLLNCKWDIDTTVPALRFEHISVFLSATIGTDLTTLDGGKWDIGRAAVTFDKEEVPNEERFRYVLPTQDINFTGYPITYDTECSGDGIDVNTEYIETEISRIFQNSEEGLEGFVLAAVNSILPDDSKVENGEFTGLFVPNAPLAWSNLHRDYFTYYRYLQDGTLNNVPTTFDSTRPIKRQENIVFPLCCLNDFNPLELVKTSVGDGRVVGAEYDLSSQKITVSLKFEDL